MTEMLGILNQRIMQTSAKLAFEKFNSYGCACRDTSLVIRSANDILDGTFFTKMRNVIKKKKRE
jgi:hypothetical protein